MSEKSPTLTRHRRGVVRRSTIEPMGTTPIGVIPEDWHYVSPLFPNGIARRQLRILEPEIQRDVALFWFLANFKPFNEFSGRQYFTYDRAGAGYGDAPYAPLRVNAGSALSTEFEENLAEGVIEALGRYLSGDWMSIDDVMPDTGVIATKEEILTNLIARIDRTLEQFEKLAPPHGYNGPPEELPLTADEWISTLQVLKSSRQELSEGRPDAVRNFHAAWANLSDIGLKIGTWLVRRIDDFGTELASAAGKSIGDKAPHLIIAVTAGTGVWLEWPTISKLLEAALAP